MIKNAIILLSPNSSMASPSSHNDESAAATTFSGRNSSISVLTNERWKQAEKSDWSKSWTSHSSGGRTVHLPPVKLLGVFSFSFLFQYLYDFWGEGWRYSFYYCNCLCSFCCTWHPYMTAHLLSYMTKLQSIENSCVNWVGSKGFVIFFCVML